VPSDIVYKFHHYKYIDDTDVAWSIKCADYLADVGGLQQIPLENPEKIPPLGPNYKPRHIRLVALYERPGMQKYRAEVITNERDPSKLLNQNMIVGVIVGGIEMRCTTYVGEQRVAY